MQTHVSAVGVGVVLPILLLLVLLYELLLGYMLPLFLQLVQALCCPLYCGWAYVPSLTPRLG